MPGGWLLVPTRWNHKVGRACKSSNTLITLYIYIYIYIVLYIHLTQVISFQNNDFLRLMFHFDSCTLLDAGSEHRHQYHRPLVISSKATPLAWLQTVDSRAGRRKTSSDGERVRSRVSHQFGVLPHPPSQTQAASSCSGLGLFHLKRPASNESYGIYPKLAKCTV